MTKTVVKKRFPGGFEYVYKTWYGMYKRHRENDLPAVEYDDGSKEWWSNGKYNRENGLPAIIDVILGYKAYYKNNKYHRENGLPAIECDNGSKEWWINGKRVNEDGTKYVPGIRNVGCLSVDED